jgi:ribosomal protein S25
MQIASAHQKLLDFLQKKEAKGEAISEQEILLTSGWQKTTFTTYLNKGQLADFLNEVNPGVFEASNTIGLSIQQFTKLLSQSKHRRGLGHNCKSRLSKALLKKSRDNMLLALELYNRPSLENRMDTFVLCFCTAWEQFLKAILIEEKGEEFIFRNNHNSARIRETISLRECLSELYHSEDVIRKNIERITYYRDQAVHLLMPEVQGIMSRIFQSGVLNYSSKFSEFTEQPFISSTHSGMLSLVGDLKSISAPALHSSYGKEIGDEILNLIADLTEEAKNADDIQFAIPLSVKLVFAKKNDEGNMVTLAMAEEGMEGLKRAIIIEKPIDRERTHPFGENAAISEINKRLYERYADSTLSSKLVARNKLTKRLEVNSCCFRAVVAKLKWKNSENQYHYESKNPVYRRFSDSAIEGFIKKVMDNDEYLKRARENHVRSMKKRKPTPPLK